MRLTIGFYLKGEYGVDPEPDVAKAVMATARLCEELGHNVKPAQIRCDVAVSKDYHIIQSRRSAENVAELERKLGRKLTFQDVEPPLLASAERYHGGWNCKSTKQISACNKYPQTSTSKCSSTTSCSVPYCVPCRR